MGGSSPLRKSGHMRSKAIRVCAGLIAISTLAACGGGKNESADSGHGIPSGPIVIGMPIALTGPINAYDGNTLTGVRLAADEINTKGGIKGHKIKVITADTASNIAQGTAAAQDVVNEGAQFLVPTIDYNYGRAAARIGAKRGLIVLGAADDTRFGKSLGDNVFNLGTGVPRKGRRWPSTRTPPSSGARLMYSRTPGWRLRRRPARLASPGHSGHMAAGSPRIPSSRRASPRSSRR